MNWFEKSVAEILTREEAVLDDIFGKGAYSIESADADTATVRFGNIEWRIGYERGRDRSVVSTLNLGVGQPWEQLGGIDTFARLLDEERNPLPRNGSGIVTLTIDEQIRMELDLLRRLQAAILADPLLTRDAALFVRGYNTAYTEYCGGSSRSR